VTHSCGGAPSTQIVKYQISAQYYLSHVKLPENYDDLDENSRLNPAQCTVELSEYAIHYNCCENNKIQLVGKKQMLVSEASQTTRK